jgi:hypothetical protein
MALIVKDRVQETSTTTGTGTFTLDGANSGFATFSSAVGNGNTTYYAIVGGTEWEVGIGTVGAGTLARTTLLASSTGSVISFSAGIKNVFCTYPASKSVTIDDIQTLTNKTINLASNTLTGTTAQFNTALSDGDFATLAGTETLTNKALNGTLGATTPSTIAATTISASGVSTFSAGSAAAPAITTSGDTNTGILFPAADTIAFSEGGVESMRIDANGNALIGTANAIGKLGVATASATGAPSVWNNGFFTVAPNGATTSGGVGLSFDTTGNTGAITCLAPSVAWRKLKYFALNHDWIVNNGATTGMTLDASSNLAITGALSFGSFLGGIGKVGTLSRNTGTGTGTVAYTGVGFKPSAIIFIAAIGTLPVQSIGYTDPTTGGCLYIDNYYGSGGSNYANAIYYLRSSAGNGNIQQANISTMDADGFTLSWTKTVIGTGAPTNTMTIYYLAFR